MNSLAGASNTTTRRLDYTYYALLEKIGKLQSSITSLRELASHTTHLYGEFKSDADTLRTETSRNLDDFGYFEAQSRRIEGFEKRLKKGRERAETLNKRLAIVRGKVDVVDKQEADWDASSQRRRRYFWTLLVATTLLLLFVMMWHHWPHAQIHDREWDVFKNRMVNIAEEKTEHLSVPENVSEVLKDAVAGQKGGGSRVGSQASKTGFGSGKQAKESDPLARVFDEL